jgi:hypothetical protein
MIYRSVACRIHNLIIGGSVPVKVDDDVCHYLETEK